LREQLLPLFDDRDRLTRIGQAAAGFGRLDADHELAVLVRRAVAES
jgi:hypothetical protein